VTDADVRAALERLLASLCAATSSATFLAEWGAAEPSPLGGRRLRIAAPADAAFAWLDVRPWDGGAIGGVEAAFADGAAPSLDELASWVGPLRELPPMPDADDVLIADWWREGLPVAASVIVTAPPDGEPVAQVHCRRGRSAPG
jgi:hypothetical protein